MHRAGASMATAAACLLLAACGGDDDGDKRAARTVTTATTKAAAPSSWVTLSHKPSSFSVSAPRGFELSLHDGVYALERGGQTITVSRAATSTTPAAYGDQLAKAIGGSLTGRRTTADELQATVQRQGGDRALLIRRSGNGLLVATGQGGPGAGELRRVEDSARGGVTLRPPKAAASTIALKPYRAPDGGATALIPSGPGWNIDGGGGTLLGSSDQGAFTLGRTFKVLVPGNAPGGGGPVPVAPYVEDPGQAVAAVLPKVNPKLSDVSVRKVVRTGVLPSYSASGMYVFDYRLDGKPWTSVSIVGVDSPEKYSNFLWQMYYSGIGVPAGAAPAVGAGLRRVWASWDPSGAIAQRSAQSKALLDQSGEVWRETSEFRARTADRQSRDVGCLLRGYGDIEDNSRAYDLPPLPCDQQYGTP